MCRVVNRRNNFRCKNSVQCPVGKKMFLSSNIPYSRVAVWIFLFKACAHVPSCRRVVQDLVLWCHCSQARTSAILAPCDIKLEQLCSSMIVPELLYYSSLFQSLHHTSLTLTCSWNDFSPGKQNTDFKVLLVKANEIYQDSLPFLTAEI
jgi:hypothetical protein